MAEKSLIILGSTGSIGKQTLEIVAQHRDRLRVVGLAAGTNATLLREQAEAWQVQHLALADPAARDGLDGSGARVYRGAEGLCEMVRELAADVVVAAISGGAGLPSLLAALEAGSDVAFANKEPLVAAGELVTQTALRHGAELRPVDSEISAVWQCLRGENRGDLEKITLTASGGPFVEATRAELAVVTAAQALNHPTWKMGPKVTVDSATLMNKGFEIFEMKWLFGARFEQIEVVVHRQSVVHSAVSFRDGSTLAQMGPPDMRTPIQFALSYPERWQTDLPRMSLPALGRLTFEAPDLERFPCLRLAREAGEAGLSYPAALSAADEVAVRAFLEGRLSFTGIAEVVERTLEAHEAFPVTTATEAARAEGEAARAAEALVEGSG
jgi:1-deoxy-D-xylulose-5-phosphate reductoisomerase